MKHPFLDKIRFLQLCNYPKSDMEGFVYTVSEKVDIDYYKSYPSIFKELAWWEKRTIDELMSIEYVQITEYTGYWRVLDIVPVTDFVIDTKRKKFVKFIIGGTQSSEPHKCIPATKTDYELWEKNGKVSPPL